MKCLLNNLPRLETPEHLKVKLKRDRCEVPTDRVIYIHRRADDGKIFYVGYGDPKKRPYNKSGRNKDWHEVYNNHDRTVQILLTNLNEHDAIIIELWLIYSYRIKYGHHRHGGFMTNLSSGGFGTSGYKFSNEQKAKLSASQKFYNSRPEVKAIRGGENHPQYGSLGSNSHNFQGYSVGISKVCFVIIAGEQEMNTFGFSQGCISSCINGRPRYKSHKGFTWTRHTTINPDDFIGLEPYNQLSAERLQNAKSK